MEKNPIHEKIIETIAEYGYMTVFEVAEITGDLRKAYGVLQYLSNKKGRLTTFGTHLRPTKAYCLSRREKSAVEASGTVEYMSRFVPSYYAPTQFYHHTIVIKVHLILEKILGNRLIEFIPEPRLKRKIKSGSEKVLKICDGELIFLNTKGERRKAGIEVELTLKREEARRRHIKNLYEYADNNLNLILLFYNREIIKERMKETINKSGSKAIPIYFISLKDFLENKAGSQAEMLSGEKIKIFG